MDIQGLALCSRFSYPPNSLSLCGPNKKKDLEWYASSQDPDIGTHEILSQFSTLFPYLSLIAYENNICDPFDRRVVEAYWIGNHLLHKIPQRKFATHLSDTLQLKRKPAKKDLSGLLEKIPLGALPYHAFHVLNVYKRTGHLDILHTVQTMNACLINWGKVINRTPQGIWIETRPLTIPTNKLSWGNTKKLLLLTQGKKDVVAKDLKEGNWVSYHWGYFCQKLSAVQLHNLIHYTNSSLRLANHPT